MNINPYAKFGARELTLNDHLAIDRTVLSNERTLLAYGRTALAMLILGGAFFKFFEDVWVQLLGVPFVLGGLMIMAWGWRRYMRTRRLLSAALEARTGSPEHPLKARLKEEDKAKDDDARAAEPAPDAATSARPEGSSGC